MSYIIEIQLPAQPPAYILATADTLDDARALVDAQLGREAVDDDTVIVAVHTIH